MPLDLIHCHDVYPTLSIPSIKKSIHVPVFSTLHNSLFVKNEFPESQIQKLKIALPQADKIIGVSPRLNSCIEKHYDVSPTFIPNMVDTDLFSPVPYKKSEDVKFVVVGGLSSVKRVIHITEAFISWTKNKRPRASLHFYGDGPDRTTIEHLAEKHKSSDTIKVHGYVSKVELSKALGSSHVLVSNSEIETFGINIFEGLSSGLPIIYSKSGVEQLLSQDLGICLKNDSIKTLTEALDKMHDQHTDYDAAKLRTFVVDNFSVQAVREKLEDLYHNQIQIT